MSKTENSVIRHYSIEDQLSAWCKEQHEYNVLWSSFLQDKRKYISRTHAIAINSGHFSRHDVTHSDTIISYIELLLGEEQIRLLSATDAWLILETAYAHDIGMYVSEEDIRQIWSTHEYLEYLIECSHSETADLREAARVFLREDDSRKPAEEAFAAITEKGYSGIDSILRLSWYIKVLTSNFRRKRHANEAATLLNLQYDDSGLYQGVPIWFYETVALCADAHGYPRESVLSETLRKEAKGYYKDYMHPRFVAMLVRMGDLLDLDNNRFDPLVIAAFGKLPESSVPHKYKHLCMNHILVTPEKIEVRSDLTLLLNHLKEDIKTIEVARTYKETHYWFGLIEDELRFWHEREYDFIPDGFFHRIPTLEKRDIYLDGRIYNEADILKDFSVDYNRVLSIVGSKNFYSEPLAFLRELIQNSFDAVKKHIQANVPRDAFAAEIAEAVRNDQDDLAVTVYLCEKVIDQESCIGIAVSDNGVGISRPSLTKLQHVGGQDPHRKNVTAMLEPTGEFGIGVHAAFAVTDVLNYRTFSEDEPAKYQFEIEARERGGRIVILPKAVAPLKDRRCHGTDVWFYVNKRLLTDALFPEATGVEVAYDQITDAIISKLRQCVAPNIADLCVVDLQGEDLTKALDNGYPIGEKTMWISSIFYNIPDGVLAGKRVPAGADRNSEEVKEEYNNLTCETKNPGTYLSLQAYADGKRISPVLLKLSVKGSKAETRSDTRVAYKGSWITGKTHAAKFELKGLTAEFHVLGRTASQTVNLQREELYAGAVSDLCGDLNRAFRQLLLYLAAEHGGKKPLDEIRDQEVCKALALHYRVLQYAEPNSDAASAAQEALDLLRRKPDQKIYNAYRLEAGEDLAGNEQYELQSAQVSAPICDEPETHSWLRKNALFEIPNSLHPTVLRCGAEPGVTLHEDLWSELEIDLTVSKLHVIDCGSPRPVLVVQYQRGRESCLAETNALSFDLMLESWMRQADGPEPVQMLPAVRIPEQPDSPICRLAVQRGDYQTDQEWPLFRAFIKMPVLSYAKRFPLASGNWRGRNLKDTYANLETHRPKYLDSLVEYTWSNQLEPEKYSRDEIREAYEALLRKLSSFK